MIAKDGRLINAQYITKMKEKEEIEAGNKHKTGDYDVTLYNTITKPIIVSKEEIEKKLNVFA